MISFHPNVQNIQHPQREQPSDTVLGKRVSAAFDDSEYDSVISKRTGLGIEGTDEKFKENVFDKTWFASGSVTPTISDQGSRFDDKHGFPSFPAQKSISDVNMQPRPNFTSRSTGGMTKSWKNSEEEEFMWDDINLRVTDQGAASNSGRDRWTPDDFERTVSTKSFVTLLVVLP